MIWDNQQTFWKKALKTGRGKKERKESRKEGSYIKYIIKYVICHMKIYIYILYRNKATANKPKGQELRLFANTW